jgi:hypothetical protein
MTNPNFEPRGNEQGSIARLFDKLKKGFASAMLGMSLLSPDRSDKHTYPPVVQTTDRDKEDGVKTITFDVSDFKHDDRGYQINPIPESSHFDLKAALDRMSPEEQAAFWEQVRDVFTNPDEVEAMNQNYTNYVAKKVVGSSRAYQQTSDNPNQDIPRLRSEGQ